MSIYRNTILAALAISCMFSCTKETPYLQGDIVGFVSTVDEDGMITDDQGGVFVKAASKTDSAETYTDETGKFVLTNLNFGQYTINLDKEGYGGTIHYSIFDHVGGSQPTFFEKLSIYKISSKSAKLDSISITPSGQGFTMQVEGEINGELNRNIGVHLVFLIGENNVSKDNYIKYQSLIVYENPFKEIIVFFDDEIQESFSNQDNYKIVVYTSNRSVGGFLDQASNKFVFPCLGEPSNVLEFAFK